MSEKEREALVVLERVRRKEITMAEATRQMGISYRQCWRRYRRYEEEGAHGLVHRLRGVCGNRSMVQEVRERIAELYRGLYEGFGPVLFAEKLEATHEIKADHETVRRLLIKEGLWRATRQAEKAASCVAGEASAFWRVGADGWVASPLV